MSYNGLAMTQTLWKQRRQEAQCTQDSFGVSLVHSRLAGMLTPGLALRVHGCTQTSQ